MTIFDTIVQIPSLKELKLSNNRLEGSIPRSIGKLAALETLDLHENLITSLPDELHNLGFLCTLDISSNQLSSIPFDQLRTLAELLASKNKLKGSLFPPEVNLMQNLRTVDITGNSITDLSQDRDLSLPSLKILIITANRITHLPNVTTWQDLVTISAEDNKISSFPNGLVSLENIRFLDFAGNDFKTLDEHLADMESLQVLRISNNPLRDKKFLNMATDDIKTDLRARLFPKEDTSSPEATTALSNTKDESHVGAGFPVKNGVLDLANKQLLTLSTINLSEMASQYTIINFRGPP